MNDITSEILTGKLILREWDTYDLVADSKLDKYALDIEAERQAELMTKWLSLLHQAQRLLTKETEALEYVEAELRIAAKKNGIEGIAKVTDATVDSWITMHPKRVLAMEAKNKAYSNMQYLNNARSVLDHKRDMIKVLDHLLVAGYYAKPGVSNEACKASETAIKEVVNHSLGQSMRRRLQDRANENDNDNDNANT